MKNMKTYFHDQMEAGPIFEDLDFFIFSAK